MNNNYCFYQSDINDSKTNQKIWYNHFRGKIIRNIYDPLTNRIIQEYIDSKSPIQYRKQIDDFFMYKLR